MSRFFKQFSLLFTLQFKEFFREPEVLFWTLAFPIGLAWVLGIAFSSEKEQINSVALVNMRTEVVPTDSFYLIKTLRQFVKSGIAAGKTNQIIIKTGNKQEGFSEFKFIKATYSEAEALVKKGKAVLIAKDYTDSLTLQFDPNSAEAKTAYYQLLTLLSPAGENISVQRFESGGMRYIDYFLPGFMAMGIVSSALWGICFSLIEKRSKKLLRRMAATPMSKSAFLGSIMSARFVLSLVESFSLFVFAYLYFGSKITGSIPALLYLILVGNICFSGMAVLLSSRTAKPQVGNALINVITLPMWICSGVFFSYQNFPEWLLPFIKAIPLTLLADTMRSVFNESAAFSDVFTGGLWLVALGLICFAAGVKYYKWS